MATILTPWSDLQPLRRESIKADVPEAPGVYRIRGFSPEGSPHPIPRCRGTDTDGILHIGHSGDLRSRLTQFFNSAVSGKRQHSAGCEFCDSGFGTYFPAARLYYDFVATLSKLEALALELQLHLEYRKVYLDKPPLDSSVGQQRPWDT